MASSSSHVSCVLFGPCLPPHSSCTLSPSHIVPYVVPYTCHAASDSGLCSCLECPPYLLVSDTPLPKPAGQGWGELPPLYVVHISFLKKFYLFMRGRERERERERERQRHRQRKKQVPCREPDVGLDPGTPGSRPEPKADAQPLSHPGIPNLVYSIT